MHTYTHTHAHAHAHAHTHHTHTHNTHTHTVVIYYVINTIRASKNYITIYKKCIHANTNLILILFLLYLLGNRLTVFLVCNIFIWLWKYCVNSFAIANCKLNSEIKCMVGCIRSVSHEFMFNSSSDAYKADVGSQQDSFWNTAIVIFIFYGYKTMNFSWKWFGLKCYEGIMAALNTWWVCEDCMSLYTSEWHHQDFGYISFVEITKNDECSVELCLCARMCFCLI